MNCEVAHERIVAAAYGELGDEQTHELERHIAGCSDCAAEREQMLALKALAEMLPVEEPSANLVARARLRLDEALDALPPRRWYERERAAWVVISLRGIERRTRQAGCRRRKRQR